MPDTEIKFDKNQKSAITCVKNAVVRAGAGSGKTTVLAERFLHLIESGKAQVYEILALTFTIKAKSEMYEKIYNRLYSSGSQAAKNALMRIDEAAISTLDSFCAEVARNWSPHFGVPPDFGYIDSSNPAYYRSLDFVLEHADDPYLARFIKINGFENTVNGFFADFAVEHVRVGMALDFERFYPIQMKRLEEELELRLVSIDEGIKAILRLPPDSRSIIAKQELFSGLPDFRSLARNCIPSGIIEATDSIDTTKPGGKANESVARMKELIDSIKEDKKAANEISCTLSESGLIRSMLSILSRFAGFYAGKKRAMGTLDYGDVAHIALETLTHNKTLRSYYKRKFKYVIIDEFQDNNSLQKNLLYLLSEREDLHSEGVPPPSALQQGKLFFVGDEKQSIYRFRGADVSVFKLLGDELKREGGEEHSLSTNYRSEPGLIDFFNGFFGLLMARAHAPYEADFSRLEAKTTGTGIEPSITFMYKPYSEEPEREFSNDESEAFALASFLSESIGKKRFVIEKDGVTRPASYDDCALLMRSTSNQIIYERMMRLFDIPFVTQGARSLFLEAPANDLYNLLQTACFPQDRAAYAGLLRSPLVNVSDSALVRILASGLPPFEPVDALSESDGTRYEAGKRAYEHICENADIKSIAFLVDFFWFECGYRFYVLGDSRFPNLLEYYGYLANLSRKADSEGKTVSEFLDFLRENLGRYERLDESDILSDETKGIRLLTIHKAKGLEFPIVILANTGNIGRNEGAASQEPYYMSETYGPTFNIGKPNYFYSFEKAEASKKEVAEIKRLLYVALTRSKTHLVLSGVHNSRNRGSEKCHLNMILRCLGLQGVEQGIYTAPYGSRIDIRLIPDLVQKDYFARMTRSESKNEKQNTEAISRFYDANKVWEARFPRIDYSVSELNEIYAAGKIPSAPIELPPLLADGFLSDANARSVFGSLCHLIISLRLKKGKCGKPDIPLSLFTNLPQDTADFLFETGYGLADRFFHSKIGKLLAGAAIIESEYPFVYRLGLQGAGFYIQGIVDLYFEAHGTGYIIDFKSDARLQVSEYAFQVSFYRLALEELFGKKIRCYLFPLRSGEAVEIEERVSEKDALALIRLMEETA